MHDLLHVAIGIAFLFATSAIAPPEQIHLSPGELPSQLVVTWSTMNFTEESTVWYGVGQPTLFASGSVSKFVDDGPAHRTQFIHMVKLSGLKPNTEYVYRCGGKTSGWSKLFTFHTMPAGSNWSPRLALYGDLGLKNAMSVPHLTRDVQQKMYDAVLHVGDFAYDMDTNDGEFGDEFLRLMEPVAANVPYLTCPGNHEQAHNFSNYKHRFNMPEDGADQMFYSTNIGPIHLISLSTEYYFYIYYGFMQAIRQFDWLERDLKEANKPENRAKQPWIITMGHRPMYCSNTDHDDCTRHESIVRTGLPVLHWWGLEKLFYKYGVDVMIWAHEHSYERLWPVYDRKVYNGSYSAPYTNPKAPVHIITGSAGCQEKLDNFTRHPQEWSAFRDEDYGYTRMTVLNSSHLYLEQVSVEKSPDGEVIDKMMLIKDKHGPY